MAEVGIASSLAGRAHTAWHRLMNVSAAAREQLVLCAVFMASRAALYAAGLHMKLELSWMFLSDPAWLRDRFFETVYHFHAFAPGMNVITGILLRFGDAHVALAAQVLFWLSGSLLLLSTYQLMRRLGFASPASSAVALAISVLPQSLYFENLYHYTHLCTSLLVFAALLFHRALAERNARAWLWFFLICAVLGLLYTTFHLLWFVLLAAAALVVAGHGQRRYVLGGVACPALLIGALYTKNLLVFGVFGATSWGGANLTLATTQIMPRQLRNEWIAEGRLSPFAGVSVFAPPRTYLKFLPNLPSFPWPTTNELERPTVKDGNYNHGLYLRVNEQRRRDSMELIHSSPRDYLRTIYQVNLPLLFHSTTHWHPLDRTPESTHYQHRKVLGRYESFYDRIVHDFPKNTAGPYVYLPVFYAWALIYCLVTTYRTARDASPEARERRRRALLLGFCLLQIAFIVAASIAFSGLESPRYRYTIEPLIWITVAVGLRHLYQAARVWGPGLSRALRAAPRG